jgi:hypothetical protein
MQGFSSGATWPAFRMDQLTTTSCHFGYGFNLYIFRCFLSFELIAKYADRVSVGQSFFTSARAEEAQSAEKIPDR